MGATTAVVLGTKAEEAATEDSTAEMVERWVWTAVLAPAEVAVLVEKPCGRATLFWAAQVSAGRPCVFCEWGEQRRRKGEGNRLTSGQQRPSIKQKDSDGQGSDYLGVSNRG